MTPQVQQNRFDKHACSHSSEHARERTCSTAPRSTAPRSNEPRSNEPRSNEPRSNERRYFAASNSCRGFVSYYPICFGLENGVEKLYIIKGGPGTGKSRFMRDVAEYASARGADVIYYYCSSDPASLDGIILTTRDRRVALVDGTPPHVCEPTIPGVQEELVNLGAFWNTDQLDQNARAIRRLCQEKSAAYARAYRYLAACGEMQAVADERMSVCVMQDKIGALAERLLRDQPTGERAVEIPALRRAMGMTGESRFDTFEQEAKRVVLLSDYYGIASRLTAALRERSRARRLRVLVSHDPICPEKIDGLFYPDTGLCIIVNEGEPTEEPARVISMRLYVDANALRAARADVRETLRLADQLKAGAIKSLLRAADSHFALEKIYSAAMDFSAKEAYTALFCRAVLGN